MYLIKTPQPLISSVGDKGRKPDGQNYQFTSGTRTYGNNKGAELNKPMKIKCGQKTTASETLHRTLMTCFLMPLKNMHYIMSSFDGENNK